MDWHYRRSAKMESFVAEFVGTMVLLILGNGVVANVLLRKTKGEDAGWLAIATAWGLAVAMAVYFVGRISGAHINPAVTIGLASIGAFPWGMVPGYLTSQLLGAFSGATVIWFAYHPHWEATEDADAKLGVFATSPGIRKNGANFLTELIATAVLLFGILALADNAQRLSQPEGLDLSVVYSGGIEPLLVGCLVWVIGLSLGGPTGYAINPARDLGPRLAHWLLPIPGKRDSDWSYSWIPIAGPLAGGILGAVLYCVVGF
jgi:glycerol uptake facilitator protein